MSQRYESRYGGRHRKAGKSYTGRTVLFILLCCGLTVFLLSTSYLGDKLVDQYVTDYLEFEAVGCLVADVLERIGNILKP